MQCEAMTYKLTHPRFPQCSRNATHVTGTMFEATYKNADTGRIERTHVVDCWFTCTQHAKGAHRGTPDSMFEVWRSELPPINGGAANGQRIPALRI